MKKWICSLVFGWVVFSASADMLVFTNINKAIPDNSEFGVQDTQGITGYEPIITSIEVYLKISATVSDFAYNGDFYATLQHDSGFSVLLNRTGRTTGDALGYGDNGFDLIFSLVGDDIHSYQVGPYTLDGDDRLIGTWSADGRNIDPDVVVGTDPRSARLDAFDGLNPNGDWTLFVADMGANGNGIIEEWGLNIATVPEPATFSMMIFSTLILLFSRSIQRRYGFIER